MQKTEGLSPLPRKGAAECREREGETDTLRDVGFPLFLPFLVLTYYRNGQKFTLFRHTAHAVQGAQKGLPKIATK